MSSASRQTMVDDFGYPWTPNLSMILVAMRFLFDGLEDEFDEEQLVYALGYEPLGS